MTVVMIGKQLGHYRVVAALGKGGMGEVWIAEDTRLHRKVALKTLPEAMAADPARRARFEREAQAIAALNHPNIVTIHSVEESEGTAFITMELIEGNKLTELIPADGLALEPFLEIALPLAEALAAAHQQGITHRDVKPDNVMLTHDGHLKVLDFGLAKLAAPSPATALDTATRTAVTAEGKILGTVSYMSPEQAEGKPVDARSDVFSLGVVLYQLATGQTPFVGDTPISTITSIIRDTPQPIGDLKPALPRHLGRIVSRCLNKDPELRYQAAKELRNDLLQLKTETTTELAAAPARRPPGRRLLAGAVLGGIVAVVALAVLLWPRSGVAPTASGTAIEPSIAVLPFTSVGSDAESVEFSSGIHNDLLIRLSKVGALKVISRTSVMEYRDTTKNLRQIADELGVANVLEGSVQRAGNRVRLNAQLVNARNDESLWAESYDRELTTGNIFDIQEDVAGQIVAALRARLTAEEQRQLENRPTENLEAYETYLRGLDYASRSEAQSDQSIAMQMMERAVALDPEFAEAWAYLGTLHTQAYWQHWDRSPERLERAWNAIEAAERLSPGLGETRIARGYYHYWGFLEYERALEEFAAAAQALPNNSQVVSGIGFVKRRQGKMDEALAMFRRAAELNPRDLVSVEAVAFTLMLVREYDEADRQLVRLLELNPANSNAYAARANIRLLASGDVPAAREIVRKGLELNLTEKDLTDIMFRLAIIRHDVAAARERLNSYPGEAPIDDQYSYYPRAMIEALLHRLAGDTRAARERYEAARVVLEARAREWPDDERIPSALGLVLARLGRKQEAVRHGLRGVEMLPYEKEALRGARRVLELAEIYAVVGEPDLAIDRLEFLLDRPGFVSRPYLRVDPTWDPIREHPRFVRLVGE